MNRHRLMIGVACGALTVAAISAAAVPNLLGSGRAAAAVTQEHDTAPSTPPGGTYRSEIPQDQRHAYFGELHLHTAMSFDAWSFGSKVTPDQAYKFARGETIMIPATQVAIQQGITSDKPVPARRAWPLDFMAVTDHSEFMGVANQFDDPDNPLSKSPLAAKIATDPHQIFVMVAHSIERTAGGPTADLNAAKAMSDTWNRQMKAANENYRPGKFTTFIAYEWTSAPDGRNLHRNVIFNSDHAPQPFTSAQSNRPEDLWSFLESVRAKGIDVIAIPHNGNASDGLMYDWNDSDKRPISEAYAQRRAVNEPLTEIAQNKGQSDTVPTLSPNDEFANFEIYDHLISRPSIKSTPNGSYIRQALGRGLVIADRVGVNPFKYGLVGGSDIHNGLSTSDEHGVGGSLAVDPHTMLPKGDTAKRLLEVIKSPARLDSDADAKGEEHVMAHPLEVGSGGLTGVWAEENNRNSIYAALKRKETFATTGTRIRVRMFGGWSYPQGLTQRPDWVKTAYAKGAAMGSDLPVRPIGSGAPTLLLEAAKDPDGANLDRIQVIKVWRDGDGYKERIFNAALTGGRHEDAATGKAPPVGNTVDLKTGKYANTIGAPLLKAEWTDPTFDPSKAAVYYARVLEIPTPRWSTLLAIANKLPIPTSVPATIQERGWSSPIWFTPKAATRTAQGKAPALVRVATR
jgi:hypothetical protein